MVFTDYQPTKPGVPCSTQGGRTGTPEACRQNEGGASHSRRFWAKVEKGGGCWTWTAHRDPRGYGRFALNRRPELAHRVAYRLSGREIPDGLELRHLCGNRACVNPDHLQPGTHAENVADTVAMGRQTIGARNPQARLSEAQVLEIRARREEGQTHRVLAAAFGVSEALIWQICQRRIWRHLPDGQAVRP